MGVQGLWSLVEESGTRVNIQTLQGKVLAVDLSIWINQAIKGFRDKDGKALENAHILGLFHRICKLLFYGVKPIFVFDGEAPILKQRTAAKRRDKTQKHLEKAKTMQMNVLEKYALSQLNMPESSGAQKAKAAILQSTNNKSPKKMNDVYEDFVEMLKDFENKINDDDYESDEEGNLNEATIEDNPAFCFSMGDCQNIRNIDIKSESFLGLTAVARYEILQEMRESYKGRKNPFPEQLPADSDEFSSFQMTKLMKKRGLQEEIDKVIDELNGHNEADGKEWAEGLEFVEENIEKMLSGKLASDEKTKFLYLKKMIANRGKASKEEIKIEDDEESVLEMKDDNSQEAYELPNRLLDQGEKFTDAQRIEHLSQLKGSQPTKFNSVKLRTQLEQNLNKVQSTSKASNLKLSDDEASSEDDDADLIEIDEYDLETALLKPPSPQSSSQSSLSSLFTDKQKDTVYEELNLPYDTSYTITIEVDKVPEASETSDKDSSNIPSPKPSTSSSSSSLIFEKTNKPEVETEKTTIEILLDDVDEDVIKEKEREVEKAKEKSKEPEVDEAKEQSKEPEVDEAKEKSEETTEEEEKGQEISEIVIDLEAPEGEKPEEEPKVPEVEVDMEALIAETKRANTIARQATSVSAQMLADCQKLLILFGCPFLISPSEAEAQCATLEELGLCEGVITDDSDIFLFGGKTVYKNFFSNDKYITQFRADDLTRYYGLDRSKLICLGMMCGTDYTVGIDGIGPVNGLEILGEFKGPGLKPLEEYAAWYRLRKMMKNVTPENKIRSKLLRFKLPESFPSKLVYDAYWNANTDQSNEKFTWSMPVLHELRSYAFDQFGWSLAKADALLLPVVKNFNKKDTQKRIEMFFPTVSRNVAVNDKLKINRSKRLNAAISQSLAISARDSPKGSKQPVKSKKAPKKQPKKAAGTSSKRRKEEVPKQQTLQLSEESSSSGED